MAQIIVQRDPSAISKSEVTTVAEPVNLLDWLCENESPDFGGLHCYFALNGERLCSTWENSPDECNRLLDITLGADDCVMCVIRPAGIELTAYQVLAIVAAVAAVAVIALAPSIKIPVAGDNVASQSNQLNSSTNSYLKIGEAVDDNAGQIVKYPKFLQPSYYEYNSEGKRFFTEYFLIGRGRHDVPADSIKEGETPVNTIDGYAAELLPAGSHPAELLNVRVNPSTQDVDLLPPGAQSKSITLGFGDGSVLTPNTVIVGTANMDALQLSPGNSVSLNLRVRDGEGVETDIIETTTVGTVSTDRFTETGNVIPDDAIILYGSITNLAFEPTTEPWFVMEGDAVTEVWFHLKMPTGIRRGNGTSATVTIALTVETLDGSGTPTGTFFVKQASFTGNTQVPQYATFKFTSEDGIPTTARYRAKAVRTSATLGDNSQDLVTLDGIASVTPYAPQWGDIDALKVTRTSTQRVNKGASTKINCLVTRKLQTFSGGGAFVPTRNFSDYVYYILSDLMGVDDANIDTATLFGIQSSLSSDELGYFDYQFDDRNSSARERLEVACNVARVRYYNEGLNWTFTREESKPVRAAMFNRRNLDTGAAQFVQKFRRPSDHDGVTLVYVDPDKNSEKRISKKIAGGSIVTGLGINSLEINLPGCRNAAQAMNRLNLEVRRLIYQNVKVTDMAQEDALIVPLGERVDWVDINDSEIFSGEIMGAKNGVYATSEPFTPTGGVDYFVYATDDEGEPSATVPCLPRSDGTVNGFEAAGLNYFTGNQVHQCGSRYVIASNSDYDRSAFTLVGRDRPDENGRCKIELAEYNELLFADD